MDSYIISTKRLGLRRWIDSDIKPFIQMNQDSEVMKYFPAMLTDSETLKLIQRIQLHFDEKNFGLFAVEQINTKEFIGFTGFSTPRFDSFFTPCIEIGWRYKKEAWGKGFATEAAGACLKYGFETLGFSKVVSFTSLINKKSESVMQRIGMAYVGEFNHPQIEKDNILCRHVLYEIHVPGKHILDSADK